MIKETCTSSLVFSSLAVSTHAQVVFTFIPTAPLHHLLLHSNILNGFPRRLTKDTEQFAYIMTTCVPIQHAESV